MNSNTIKYGSGKPVVDSMTTYHLCLGMDDVQSVTVRPPYLRYSRILQEAWVLEIHSTL